MQSLNWGLRARKTASNGRCDLSPTCRFGHSTCEVTSPARWEGSIVEACAAACEAKPLADVSYCHKRRWSPLPYGSRVLWRGRFNPLPEGACRCGRGRHGPQRGELTVSSNIQMRKYYETIRIRTS